MSILHQMAVSAALRRTRTLAVEDQAPAAYPVIVDAFKSNASGGLSPALTVVTPSASRATSLIKTIGPDALSVTCRVPPQGAGDLAPWVTVHTMVSGSCFIEATGTSLVVEAAHIETGDVTPRQGPSRILIEALDGADAALTSTALTPGEIAFLYTEDPYASRPISEAFYWPSAEGFLLTAQVDGFGYSRWQMQLSCLLGIEGEG